MLYLAQQDVPSVQNGLSTIKEIQQIWPFGAILAIVLALVLIALKWGWAPFRKQSIEFKSTEKKLREEEAEGAHKREQELLQLKLQIELAKANQTEQMTHCSRNNVKAQELHVELTKQQMRLQELLEPHIKVLKA